jgi:D-glycero-D-manno-heptose 1,7-bisphosphate phosphatase
LTRLVILDRDGVINQNSEHYIRSAAEWHALPGALDAIAKLTHAGYTLVIATNQAGVGKGTFSEAALEEIHRKLLREVADAGGHIDHVFACLHRQDELCGCRKPQPGMLIDACQSYGVSPGDVPFVGDSARDIKAALAAGCRPVLVLTGDGQLTRTNPDLPVDLPVYSDLLAFAMDQCK